MNLSQYEIIHLHKKEVEPEIVDITVEKIEDSSKISTNGEGE